MLIVITLILILFVTYNALPTAYLIKMVKVNSTLLLVLYAHEVALNYIIHCSIFSIFPREFETIDPTVVDEFTFYVYSLNCIWKGQKLNTLHTYIGNIYFTDPPF
jgi:hypothetical protein